MRRLLHWITFMGFMVWEVAKGTYADFRATFNDADDLHPAIVEVKLRCRSDIEIALYAWAITIPPSTAVIAIAAGDENSPASMFVHLMHRPDEAEIMKELRHLETMLLRCTRKEFVE